MGQNQPKAPPVSPDQKPVESAPEKGYREPGMRNVRTTNVFRYVNFELYAKPNTVTMIAGTATFSLAVGYILYMRWSNKNNGTYTVIKEDGSLGAYKRTSKWE